MKRLPSARPAASAININRRVTHAANTPGVLHIRHVPASKNLAGACHVPWPHFCAPVVLHLAEIPEKGDHEPGAVILRDRERRRARLHFSGGVNMKPQFPGHRDGAFVSQLGLGEPMGNKRA